LAFYFAAIGSAVGFGNVWRFPSLVYEYGGGAFFIPYVLALLLIGIPLLVLEFALGQYYETGDVNVFGGIHKRLRGVGLSSIACGYMLVTYYSMLLAWVANAFFDSFGDNFWAQPLVTGSDAKAYFYNEIIGMSTLGPDNRPTRIVGKNVGYALLTWFIVYLCIAFGIQWTGRITYFTMGLPIVLLFVFLGRALTLPGSDLGVDEYIRDANWEVLTDRPEVWSKAVSQIFFSIGVTFGIMTAYASHCKRNEHAFTNACVVAISNSLFSFISGFAVFAALGHLASLEDLDSVKDLEYTSFGLVFGSWPVVLGTLSGGEHWIRLLFFMLFLLGIDSAFSFMEGFLTCLMDTRVFSNVDQRITSGGLTMSAWLISIMYATDAGLIFLDTIDYYINFVMLLVGGFECFAAGWVYNIHDQVESLGPKVVFGYMITTFGSVIVGCALWFGLANKSAALWAGFVGWIGTWALGMVGVVFFMKKRMDENPGKWTWKSMFYELTLKDVMDLKHDLSEIVGYIPALWAVLVKHFIPPVILILFSLGADAETDTGKKVFGHYENYVFAPYQILGIMIVVFAGFLFVSSLVYPDMYAWFEKPINKNTIKSNSIHAEQESTPKDTENKDEETEKKIEDVEAAQDPKAEQPEQPPEQARVEDASEPLTPVTVE